MTLYSYHRFCSLHGPILLLLCQRLFQSSPQLRCTVTQLDAIVSRCIPPSCPGSVAQQALPASVEYIRYFSCRLQPPWSRSLLSKLFEMIRYMHLEEYVEELTNAKPYKGKHDTSNDCPIHGQGLSRPSTRLLPFREIILNHAASLCDCGYQVWLHPDADRRALGFGI